MTVKERMIGYLSYRKLGQNAFEREAGITIGYVNKVKNTITTPILEKILKVSPDLNRDWLLYGEGEMLKSNIQPESSTNADLSIERLLSIIESQQRTIEILTQKL